MKKPAEIFYLIMLISCLFISSSCGISAYQKNLYNDNSKIIKQGDSYSFIKRVGNSYNNKTSIKFGTFYGMETLWTIDAKSEGNVRINYKIQISRGKFKIVFISPDNEIKTICENTQNGSIVIKAEMGKSRIKIVGNDAKGEVEISLVPDGDIKIYSEY